MARKVVILARECNLKVELHDVDVQSLVPEPLRDSPSAEAFLEGLPQASLHRSAPYQQCCAAQRSAEMRFSGQPTLYLICCSVLCCAALTNVLRCHTMTGQPAHVTRR